MRDLTRPIFMDPTSPNPFRDDIFVDHPENLPGVFQIHQETFAHLVDAIEGVSRQGDGGPAGMIGRTFLITAPRAGYGKSHLVARLRHRLGSAASTARLPFEPSRPISWTVLLSSLGEQFAETPGHQEGDHSLLDEIGRHFLSRIVLGHLAKESVDPGDCPAGEPELRTHFVELFSRSSPSQLLGWTDERFDELAENVEEGFLKNLGLRRSECRFWTRLFLDRERGNESAIDALRGAADGEARERTLQFLRLAAFHRPLLVVADGLDGFFASESAGLEMAGIITAIREEVPRSVTTVCLNEDVWESVFANRLPSAWLDRLSGDTAKLHPLTREAAKELVVHRLGRVDLPDEAAKRFAERLAEANAWSDLETKLHPREVLRQARDLWDERSREFTKPENEVPTAGPPSVPKPSPAPSTGNPTFFPAPREDHFAPGDLQKPAEPGTAKPPPPNPFFAPPPRAPGSKLAGIDSIIDDIRGSGSRVVSETSSAKDLTKTRAVPTLQAGSLEIKPADKEESPATQKWSGFAAPPSGTPPAEAAAPVTLQSIEDRIKSKQRELLDGPPLQLDLGRLETFLQTVGSHHEGLSQTEERFPGSQSVCLRWQVRGQSVLVGFESPQNVYFWNNLLQQSLASNRREKISAFSHPSEPFDPGLFAGFGFSPTVIRGRIDPIEMSDRELAMLYAAESTLGEFEGSPEARKAVQLIAFHLDPLWRRISQPV